MFSLALDSSFSETGSEVIYYSSGNISFTSFTWFRVVAFFPDCNPNIIFKTLYFTKLVWISPLSVIYPVRLYNYVLKETVFLHVWCYDGIRLFNFVVFVSSAMYKLISAKVGVALFTILLPDVMLLEGVLRFFHWFVLIGTSDTATLWSLY